MSGNPPASGGGAPAAPDDGIDVASLIKQLGALGQCAAQEFTDSAAKSADAARHGTYNADAWLDDLKLFWDGVAKYAKAGIDVWRNQLPTS
jgi:hypothetical protein